MMSDKYVEIPENFSEISHCFTTDLPELKDIFFRCETKCFYDTCALQHHSNINDKSIIIDFLKNKCGLMIVTRTVLMELAGEQHLIQENQINYINEMYEKGIPIALINEEDFIEIIREAIELSNKEANTLLSYAVKQLSRSQKAVNQLKNQMTPELKSKLFATIPGNRLLFEDFFNFARNKKESGDSLAEELIFICLILLTKMPFGKYIFLSDDLASVPTVCNLQEYIKKHHNMDCLKMISTVKITNILVENGICTETAVLKNILTAAFSGKIPVFCLEENDLTVQYKTFDKEVFLQKLQDENFDVRV